MSVQKKNARKSLKTLQATRGSASLVGRSTKSPRNKLALDDSNFGGEIYKDENTLQTAATEIVIRKSARNLKHQRPADKEPVEEKPKGINVGVQVSFTNTITEAILTSPTIAADNHWQPLAEKRQKLIETLLEEKYQMQKKIDQLSQELEEKKQMLEEANSLVEVIKDLANNSENDDTGIDVGDVSACENGNADTTIHDEC